MVFACTRILLLLTWICCSAVPVRSITSDSLQLNTLRYNECGRYACSETGGKYQFRFDNIYIYDYTLVINSTFDNRDEKSDLTLQFRVELKIRSCDGVLRVKRLKEKQGLDVFNKEEADKIYDDVGQSLLRFSFYDGSIFNVCPMDGETISSLNIKKGILSAFQNKMKRFDIDRVINEKDVNGLCPTQYNLEKVNGTSLVIRKVKDIPNCLERYQLHSVIPTSKYVFQSKFNKWAPLNSSVVCHQTIDHSIPVHIYCTENHTLKLTNMTYSSRTRITQTLQLVQETTATLFDALYLPDFTSRQDLSFDHTKPKKSETSELEESETLLKQLCSIATEEFQPDAASTFTKFIHTARHLSYDALELLLEQSSDICSTGRKHVQDSLPFLRSTAAVQLMKQIIINGNISESQANGWLFAMSLFSRPDEEVIQSVTPLLITDDATNNMLLSISSVIHSFCSRVTECDEHEIIIPAILFLEKQLNQTLHDSKNTDKIIVLLKSLANAGVQTKSIQYTLRNCIIDQNLPVEIRLTAIESHRRFSCDYNIEFLLNIYANVHIEAEIRIAAYLQLMRCPTYGAIKTVKNKLEDEEVNQVGSFVWSHLQNAMKSPLNYRIELQSILQDYNLQKKFRSDFRKYSKNFEQSFFLNDYGIGGVISGNIIFSTKTYIPKYLSINVTMGIYGETVNVLEATVFLQGFEKLSEKFFKNGAQYLVNEFEKQFPSLRFLRSLPNTLKEQIRALPNYVIGNFHDPMVSFSFKLFGNEVKYVSCRNKNDINELFENFDIYKIIKDLLNGKEIKYDYSTVFMDISYVSPTGAGVPLNLDAVGISIINFDTAVYVDASKFSTERQIFIDGKFKPRFSVNFEGTMGTDLVYEQTQIQLKSKMFTASEVEGNFHMNSYENISLSLKLPLKKFNIFTLESDLFLKNNEIHKDVILNETAMSFGKPYCFWPLLDQIFGLKICSTYNIPDSTNMLSSFINMLKGPFKFSLYIEKSDPTAVTYMFRYNKKFLSANESSINMEFETPNSLVERTFKMLMFTTLENSNITISIHCNKTELQAYGVYKNTPNDKVINFFLDINGEKHIDLILELHSRQDKRMAIYNPKLYFAITSKPVAELSGIYAWTEKKGVSQCEINLQFKTNKFDSNITGYILIGEGTGSSNLNVVYKFQSNKAETLNFDFQYKDKSNKLTTTFGSNTSLESSFYPEINFGAYLLYHKSYDRVETKLDYISNPLSKDDRVKCKVQLLFAYFRSFNGLKLNSHLQITKPVTDVNVKFGISYHSHTAGSNSVVLVRYATAKEIVVKLDIVSPQSSRLHYEFKFNTTLPTVQQPLIVHLRINERFEREYDVEFDGMWFSGHTAKAKGIIHDKSTHYKNNYFIKLLLSSRLFNEILIQARMTFFDDEYKITATIDHNNVKYEVVGRHLVTAEDVYDTQLEYVYNDTARYSLDNKINMQKKEIRATLTLDKIRQIHLVARGTLLKWNSNVGIELQWDVNRDPSQKLIISFNTRSTILQRDEKYHARFVFEYPGHTSEASLLYQIKDSLSTLTAALEMNPTSLIEVMAYHQNEMLTKGIAQVGFQLLTPFENWRESAFTFGMYTRNQKFQTNGSLIWQGNQSIIFDTRGGYEFDDNKTSITLSSFLNSTLQDLSALAFGINYTSVVDLVHLSFLLQPNLKYSLQVSTTGYVTHYANATEYNLHVATRTPFLEYVETELNTRLKFMTENRINSDASLRLNNKIYTLYIKGILHPFEKTKLCLHLTTPYAKYEDVSGILFYDPEEKHVYVNLTSLHLRVKTDIVYAYNNLSNFHLKVHLVTPMSYLSKLLLVAMYNGKTLDLGFGWNSFTLRFAGAAHFSSWTDLEYNIQLHTPIESFRESNAIVKSYVKDEQVIAKASIRLSNFTKAGINLEYNSEQSKVTYLDECDNYYDKDTPGIYKSTVLSNAVFELDTLIYPTIMGQYHIRKSDNRYTLESDANIFFFKANLWDQLDYENITSFNNTLRFVSSIDMITSLTTTVNMKETDNEGTNSSIETEIVTFGQKLKIGGDMNYQYQPLLDNLVHRQNKTKWQGIHHLIFNLHTPFELLDTGKIVIVAAFVNYATETNINVITKSTNASLHSIVELYENFFDLNADFNISSIYIYLPSYKLQILRDFSKLEKRIILTLKKPISNSQSYHEVCAIRGIWYLDDRNSISLAGELKSPFHILNELKVSLQYSHERNAEIHNLEAFMKYSNQTEMKARAQLIPPNVTLNLESTMEGLKQAHFEGTLERTGAGQQKIDAVMITNHNFRIQGSSSVTDIIPFSIKGKLLKGKESTELSNVEMYVKKTEGGYNVLAALYSKGKTLNVDTRITDFKDNTRIINLKIVTARGDVERLEVDAELKLQHPGIYVLTVKGDSANDDIKGSSISKVEIWFRDGIAALFLNSDSTLDLTPISAKAEIFAAWKPPYKMFATANIQYSLQRTVTELLNARLYFYRAALLLSDLTTGISINFNRKWMIEANLTTIIKSSNDSKMATHLFLPNKRAYSLIFALQYNKQFNEIQHLLTFSRPKDTPCFTLSDINLVQEDIRGFFAFRCGIRDTLYMVDDFTGKKTRNKVTLRNLMKSNTLSNSLIADVNYEKRYSIHTAELKFYYPPSKLIASADVNFESTDNFDCFINTTTPFRTIPYFASEINAKTEPSFYQRYGKIYLYDKPALFNITQVKIKKQRSILNEGEVIVIFPVTTWHQANLIYVYEDTLSHINGSAELLYNEDKIFNSVFTKDSRKTSTRDNDYTHLEINNDFMPIGMNYFHETNNPYVSSLLRDFKRTEIYNLKNSTSFNLTGEALVENEGNQEWTTFKLLNYKRSIVLKAYTNGADLQENGIYVTLKPQFWFNYGLRTNKTITNTTYAKLFDMNIAYPRRNFSLLGNFGYGPNYLGSRFVVFNYMANPRKAIGIIFNSEKSLNNLRETTTTLFHPSFKKNVTLYTTFSHNKSVLADMYADLEYSPDPNRKLVLNGIILDESYKENRNYKLHLKGKHPATKFFLDVSGILHSETGVHFIGNNISYKRSYLPEHYWIGKAILNTRQYMIEVERVSLRGKILFYGDYGQVESKHVLNTVIVEASAGTDISGKFEVDLDAKETHATINLTSDATDYLKIEGNVPENREAKFNIWRSYNDFNFPQLSFYLALNHSRFLSSALLWRTDIGYNLLRSVRNSISYLWISAQESIEFWTQFLRSEVTDTVLDIWHDAKPDMQEFIDDFNNIKTIQDNINYFKSLLNESYHANEFFLKDIHHVYIMLSQEVSILDKIGSLPKIVNELWQSMGETGETIRKSLVWFVNTVKEFYEELMNVLDELVEGKAEIYIAKFIKKATEKFDNFVKDLHISFISSTESVMNELIQVLSHYWTKILLIFEPTFIEIIHHIDTTFWSSTRKLADFIYARKDEFLNSPYILRSANLTQKLDSIYKDFSKNDLITNVKKYAGVIFDTVYEYYFSQIPFRDELKSIGNEIWEEIKQLYKLQLIAYTVDNIKIMCNQAIWIYEYFDVTSSIQKFIPFLYRQFYENSYTALENEMKVHKPKTKFLFDPESGIIKLEQKLPFPWHAFNETPIYEEIEEYKFIKRVQSYLSKSKIKLWSMFNTAVSLLDPDSWFPPFKGYAIIVGLNNYITFDSRHVPFYGNSCQYLLSHDFIDEEFSLVLNGNREHSFANESISLLTEGETITINFSPASITLDSRKATSYPLQLNQTHIYFDHNIITVKNKKGITLECNMYYNICTVHLSGWFFGKVTGLLGTMNNEPSDDVTFYKKNKSYQEEWYLWPLSSQSQTCPAMNSSTLSLPDNGVNEKCALLFTNTTSPFEPCFSEVNPAPFYDICTLHLEDEKVCAAAMAYIQSCRMNSVPIRIPPYCVKCDSNGKIHEGDFKHLEGKQVPQSSDIVFIVEAKSCNKDLFVKKNIQHLINAINKESISNHYTNNKYALVVFGGDEVHNGAHSIIINDKVFANVTTFSTYFENITTGNGNSDIFAAIRFASKLSFRMGVSKTFILIPCSNCDPSNMVLDYSVLHHAMIEKSIILHILMNETFPPDRKDAGKVLFGLDGFTAYTKDDYRSLKGDNELRRSIKLTKSLLGYCIPLALESNGTLFTAKYLGENGNIMKKFATVFSKRVAQTMKPNECQECECHSDKNGIPYFECLSCSYPSTVNFDFGVEDETDLESVLSSDTFLTRDEATDL